MSAEPAPDSAVIVNAAGAPQDLGGRPEDHPLGPDVDVWWGAFASRTMLPSWLGCALVTGVIVWTNWFLQARGVMRLCLVGAACLVFSWQCLRWANRAFGFNYRLTTRQLFSENRVLARRILRVDLRQVKRVEVRRVGLEQLLGVGRVVLLLEDNTQPPVILTGVKDPERIAEMIRGQVHRLRSDRGTP
jgi:hypothetical protein